MGEVNRNLLFLYCVALLQCISLESCGQRNKNKSVAATESKSVSIETGAAQTDLYIPFLKGKRVALMVNQTSTIHQTHLLDTLLALKINVVKIFAPEHGFRGHAEAGEVFSNEIDKKTNLPIVSLYGKNKKPGKEILKDIDVVVFDIQDVGARFFTYISSMHYLMQGCAENDKELLILDRPNPHGNYIDGPLLEPKFKSFIGMHTIPIIHGLTIGELAGMINGENWLDSNKVCKVKVIKVKNYTHKTHYIPPIRPSPNLPDSQSVKLYPSLCFFEGTSISLGRGTTFPFKVIGAPDKIYGNYVFVPRSIEGMAKNPLHEGVECYGLELSLAETKPGLNLSYLINFYALTPDKNKFFIPFFNTVAGNATLQQQIKDGWSESKIKASWKSDLENFQKKRKSYLLYEDF